MYFLEGHRYVLIILFYFLSLQYKIMIHPVCLKDCKRVLRLGVRTGHPRFFNQISCGLDLVSMAGEWLTATANTNI